MNPTIQIDTLHVVEKIDSLSKQLNQIIDNTNAFKDGFSTFFTYSSLAASIVTVFGVAAVFIRISNRSISNRRQKKIILDLLRHIMVNNAILEIILKKRAGKNGSIPVEGTLERFATLEDDMDLGKFSGRAKNYEKLHNVSLLIRNYNSIVCYADKHMHNKEYPNKLLEKELNDIFKRSKAISDELLKLSKEMHLFPITNKDFAKYVKAKYSGNEIFCMRSLFKKDSKFYWKNLGKEHKVHRPKYAFYIRDKRCHDYDKINLGDIYNSIIDDFSRRLLY